MVKKWVIFYYFAAGHCTNGEKFKDIRVCVGDYNKEDPNDGQQCTGVENYLPVTFSFKPYLAWVNYCGWEHLVFTRIDSQIRPSKTFDQLPTLQVNTVEKT